MGRHESLPLERRSPPTGQVQAGFADNEGIMAHTQISTDLTKAQARAITDKINAASTQLHSLLTEAHDRKAWKALGYSSWRDYATAEFSISQSRAYQLLDQARVVTAVREAANSTMVEISERQAREIKPVVKEVAAEIRGKVESGADPIQTTYAVIEAKRTEVKSEPAKPSKPAKAAPTVESLLAENATLREALQLSLIHI